MYFIVPDTRYYVFNTYKNLDKFRHQFILKIFFKNTDLCNSKIKKKMLKPLQDQMNFKWVNEVLLSTERKFLQSPDGCTLLCLLLSPNLYFTLYAHEYLQIYHLLLLFSVPSFYNLPPNAIATHRPYNFIHQSIHTQFLMSGLGEVRW